MNRLLVGALTALMLATATSAPAAILNATPASMAATLGKAKSGDTVKLAGELPFLLIDRRDGLTLDLSRATVAAIVVKSAKDLRIQGGTIRLAPKGRPGIAATNAVGLTISNVRFEGDGTTNAVILRDSRDVEISDCPMIRPRVGVSASGVQNLKILRNRIEGWSADGIGMSAVSGAEISNNEFLDPIYLDNGIHVDAIQGYFTGATPNEDMLIKANTIRGGGTQGIFFAIIKNGPIPRRIRVIENVIATADAPRGISLDGAQESEIADNRVSTLPGSKWQTGISAVKAQLVRRKGNRVEAFGKWRSLVD